MIVVDVEASGVDPFKNSVLSVGAIDLSHPTEQFYGECRLWDGAHIDPAALECNGFTRQEITGGTKQSEAELVKAFLLWISNREDHTTAGQNPSFDRDFLKAAAERAKINWPLAYRTVDLHSVCIAHMISRGITPEIKNHRTNLDSDAISKYVGLPAEARPHNALNGAKIEAEALSRLIFNKNLLPEFADFPIPWTA
jgi:DNA polymerase III epsilon subunit-like protein